MNLWRRQRGIEEKNSGDVVNVTVTRGSVSMGDDAEAPHERQWTFPLTVQASAAIDSIVSQGYLPSIAGGRHAWIVTTKTGEPLAVVAMEGKQCHLQSFDEKGLAMLVDSDRPAAVRLHFAYEAQADPRDLYQRFRQA